MSLNAMQWVLKSCWSLIAISCAMPSLAFAQEGDTNDAQVWIERFDSGDVEQRRDAVNELAYFPPEALLPATERIIELLDDPDTQVWAGAIKLLAKLGDNASQSTPKLLEQIQSRDNQRSYRAAYALGKVAATKLDEIAATLSDAPEAQRQGLALALSFMTHRSAEAAKLLVKLLADESDGVSSQAVASLGLLGNDAVAALNELPEDPPAPVRRRVAEAAALIGPTADPLTPRLLKWSADADSTIAASAILALGSVAGDRLETREALANRLNSTDTQIQQATIASILRCSGDRSVFVAPLVQLLESGSESASLAAFALGQLPDNAEETVPALLRRGIHSQDTAALDAVAQLGPNGIPLIMQFARENDTLATPLAELVARIGTPAKPALLVELQRTSPAQRVAMLSLARIAPDDAEVATRVAEALHGDDPSLRAAAASALGAMQEISTPVQEALVAATADSDAEVRAASLETLIGIEPKSDAVATVIAQGFRDEDANVRRRCAEAIGQLSSLPAAANQTLIAALADSDPNVRAGAAGALGRAVGGKSDVAVALVELLNDESSAVRLRSMQSLASLGHVTPEIVTAVEQRLGSEPLEELRTTVETLGVFGHSAEQAVPSLRQLIDHPDESIRIATLHALAGTVSNHEELVPMLMTGLDDSEWSVRRIACEQLAKLGANAKSAVPRLLALLQTEPDVDAAANAIREIDAAPPEAVPLLIEILSGDNRDRRIRYYALHLLRKAGPAAKEALPLLERLANEGDERSREFIQRAISEIESN